MANDAEDGAVRTTRVLDEAETIGNVTWPAGTQLGFDAQDRVVLGTLMFATPETFAGVRWEAGTLLQCGGRGQVLVAGRALAEAEGIWPKGAWLVLDVRGRAASAGVRVEGEAYGVVWPPNTTLILDARAKLVSASANIAAPLRWHGTDLPAGAYVELDPRTADILSVHTWT